MLRAANQRLSSHMENSPWPWWEMDHQLQLHYRSSAVQLLGWLAGPRRLLDGPAGPGIDGTTACSRALQRLQSGQESQNRAETCFVQDGTEVHRVVQLRLTDADGQVTPIMALVQDVSGEDPDRAAAALAWPTTTR